MSSGVVRRVEIHPAPTRPILYLGVERPLAAVNGMLALMSFVLLPPGFLKFLAPVTVLAVLHPVFRFVTRRDPRAMAMYSESLVYQDFYPPASASGGPVARYKPFRAADRKLL